MLGIGAAGGLYGLCDDFLARLRFSIGPLVQTDLVGSVVSDLVLQGDEGVEIRRRLGTGPWSGTRRRN